MEDKQLPEAPISIHVDSYLDGFHVGWTKRLDGDNLSEQVAGMGAFIKKLKDEGYMPSWNSETNAKVSGVKTPEKFVEQTREAYEDRATIDAKYQKRICGEHQVEMERKISSKTDKPYWSHRENGQICFGKGLV